MRILAKKRFVLRTGAERFITEPLVIKDMPDKFSTSKLFMLACSDGDIQIIASPIVQKAVENNPGEPNSKRKKASSKAVATEKPETSDKPPDASTIKPTDNKTPGE